MSNDEFLLNWLIDTIVKPFCAYTREELDAFQSDLKLAWIVGGVLVALCIISLIIRFVVTDYDVERCAGALSLLFGMFGAGLLLCNGFRQSTYLKKVDLYNNYLSEMKVYETQVQELSDYNKEMLETRKSYTIYLNGQEILDGEKVSYDRVLLYRYNVDIDDDQGIIYLS